jgi:hypothetical protein
MLDRNSLLTVTGVSLLVSVTTVLLNNYYNKRQTKQEKLP